MTDKKTIRVVGTDMMCFPVDAETLKPLRCGVYDPWAWSDPEPGEQISTAEWDGRCHERRIKERKQHIEDLKTEWRNE